MEEAAVRAREEEEEAWGEWGRAVLRTHGRTILEALLGYACLFLIHLPYSFFIRPPLSLFSVVKIATLQDHAAPRKAIVG